MNMSDQIIQVLNYLCDKIGFTIDWTADNVWPHVETLFQKFITWEISTSWMWIGIMVALVLLALIPAIIIHNTCDWGRIEWFLFTFLVVIALGVIGVQVYDIITCYTFPEKVIYEYLRETIGNNEAYR